jgi:hypothetical protein
MMEVNGDEKFRRLLVVDKPCNTDTLLEIWLELIAT